MSVFESIKNAIFGHSASVASTPTPAATVNHSRPQVLRQLSYNRQLSHPHHRQCNNSR